jgi:GDP-4-dehydro-6-deoxy-D-mannose reductase
VYQSGGHEPLTEDSPLLPSNPYGLSKLAQDDLALRVHAEDGLDIVVARPFNHAGPRQSRAFAISSFARQIALAEAGAVAPEIEVGNLDARRDISDVRDVVEAYEHLMETATAGRPYNVASGRAYRVGDLLDELIRAARTPVRVLVDQARLRPNDIPVIVGDATRARTEVAWQPHIPIEQTLADTLDWWRAELPKTA